MKRLYLFFLFTFLIVSFSNAQDFKPKYILAGNLFYTQNTTNGDFLPKGYNMYDRAFGICPSFGFVLGKGFALGIGVDFQYSSENYITSFLLSDGYYFQERIRKGNNYGPLVYLKYVRPLNNRISIGLKLKSTCLVQKSKTKTESLNWVDNSGNITYGVYYPYFGESSVIVRSEPGYLFQSILAPEVQYKITPQIGLQASFNGLVYSFRRYKLLGEPINYSSFSIELNPSSWQFGVFFLLGEKYNAEAL